MSCPYPEYRRGGEQEDRCDNTHCPAWEDCPGIDDDTQPEHHVILTAPRLPGRTVVYIAGRMSGPEVDYLRNCARMLDTYRRLVEAGYAPICPAADLLLGIVSPNGIDVETYKDCSMAYLRRADVVFVTNPDDITPGQQAEIDVAARLGVPVVYDAADLDGAA